MKMFEDSSATESSSHFPSVRTSIASRAQRNVSAKSSVIEIDCEPPSSRRQQSAEDKPLVTLDWPARIASNIVDDDCRVELGLGDVADDVSEVASIIAEPPKQLKLEEYLNKLNGTIADKQAKTTITPTDCSENEKSHMDLTDLFANLMRKRQTNSVQADIHKKADNDDAKLRFKLSKKCQDELNPLRRAKDNGDSCKDEDEDEFDDCKSHSSVLEKLSSLTLETKLKMDRPDLPIDKSWPTEIKMPLSTVLSNANYCAGSSSGSSCENGSISRRRKRLDELANNEAASQFFTPLSNPNFVKPSLTNEENEILSHAPNGITQSDSTGTITCATNHAYSPPSFTATMKFGQARSSAESSLESGDSGAVSQSSSASFSSANGHRAGHSSKLTKQVNPSSQTANDLIRLPRNQEAHHCSRYIA